MELSRKFLTLFQTCLILLFAGAFGNYSKDKYNEQKTLIRGPVHDSSALATPYTSHAYPSHYHPLDPLSAIEMKLAAQIIRTLNTTSQWQFKFIGLRDPDKALIEPYFNTATQPPSGLIPRKANVEICDPVTRFPILVTVNLNDKTIERWREGKPTEHIGEITTEDSALAQKIALADPDVISRIKAKGIDINSIVADTFDHGYIADNPTYSQANKLVQIYFYYTKGPGNNYYAHPLDFAVYVELGANVVRGIEDLPIQQGFDATDRTGNSVPTSDSNIFLKSLPANLLRRDLHRLQISQPEGASYKIIGREVYWHGFNFRIGFNPREGFYFYTITYNDNGNVRPIIYRLSLSEVYVSYGDPRPPYHRKSNYDLGNGGFGHLVQTLPVHQYCRGNPTYMSIDLHNEEAYTWRVPSSLCITEEDAGVFWTHKDDFSGKMTSVRNQRLVVSSLVSYGNIEYYISWRFYQDATIDLAIKVTGIPSTNLMAVDVKDPLYGNLMSPQVYTQYYQHFFSVRIDADVDGINNTVSTEDISRVSQNVDATTNPYGNGITVISTELLTPGQAATDSNARRFWRISNKNAKNKLNGKPTSYKVVPEMKITPNLLALDSPIRDNRLSWANHNMWVLPYDVDHMFASGQYLDTGVNKWTNEDSTVNIDNEDVVMWFVFNYLHVPEVEDWPVTSSISDAGFSLRPGNFFANNPALYSQRAYEMTALDGAAYGYGQ